MEYIEHGYNADDMENIFNQAARILRNDRYERPAIWDEQTQRYRLGEPYAVRPCREWHSREQGRYPIHPIIRKALRMSRPTDWQLLLLQWPHESTTDKMRLAYTRDERSGEADRQVVTSIGKYLTAHFHNLPAHAVRDLVALASDSDMKFVHTTAEMIYHLHRGPRSCMVWGDTDVNNHPYKAYDPALGWHMAVRIYDGDTVGRALCNTDANGNKYFVRTYKKCPNGGYSNADETLAAWLKTQGYLHYSEYPWGTKLTYISRGHNEDQFLAPYLDGGNQEVDIGYEDGKPKYLVVDDCGTYTCNQTDGTTEESGGEECNDCGSREHDDDMYWVGRYDDHRVCESCRDDNYRYAYGSGGSQYYEHEDNVEWVEGWDEYVVSAYISDNDLVRLDNGDLCDEGDAVCINDRWYHTDDDRIVYCEHDSEYRLVKDCVELHDGEWAHEDDAWKCYATSDWYLKDDVEPVVIDGETYHPDDAPEQDEDDEEDEVAVEQAPLPVSSTSTESDSSSSTTYILPPDDERFALVA